jgi:hypothetical protein
VNSHEYIDGMVQAAEKHRARLDSIMRPLVLRALDAADIAPDSAAGRYALDAAADAGQLVRDAEIARDAAVDREIAAVDLVLMAARETARGVRTVRG